MIIGYRLTIPVVIMVVFCITAVAQEDMMFVDNSIFDTPLRPPAAFAHDSHNDTAGIGDCSVCHHVYENGIQVTDESSEDQRCSECHEPIRFGKGVTLMKAFHKNCKGCHFKRRKGPILCGECHKKEK